MKFIPITVVETKLPASFPQHEMLFLRENRSSTVYALPHLDVSYHYPPAVPWHWPWFCVDHAYCCQISSCNIINGLAAYFIKTVITFCKRLPYEFDFSCKKNSHKPIIEMAYLCYYCRISLWAEGNIDMYLFYVSYSSHSYDKRVDESKVGQLHILVHISKLTSLSP